MPAPGSIHPDIEPLAHALKNCMAALAPKNERFSKTSVELGFSYHYFRDLYKHAPVGYLFIDKNGRIIDINIAGAQTLGKRTMGLIGHLFEQFILEEDICGFRQMLDKLLSGNGFCSQEIRLSLPGDKIIRIRLSSLLSMSVNENGQAEQNEQTHLLFTFLEIAGHQEKAPCASTETKAACSSREKLRLLSQETMTLLENERRTIAKEIHDSLGGSLAAIKFLMEKISSENSDNPEIALPLNQTIKHLQDTIKETKRISGELRPTMLDDLGLEATVTWFCRSIRESFPKTMLLATIKLNEKSIDETQKIIIYRIIQEGISNAVKDGRASSVWLSLVHSGRRVKIRIRTKMKTVGANAASSGICLEEGIGKGLRGIKEKTEICGGSLFITCSEKEGTLLTVSMPAGRC